MIRKSFAVLIAAVILNTACSPTTSASKPAGPIPPNASEASGPIIVGGGAGQSEFSVAFVRTSLDQLIKDCFEISCKFSAEKKARLQKIQVKAQKPPVAFFRTSKDMGDHLFLLKDDAINVLINQDLLWLDQAKTQPYEMSDAAKLWVDILAVNESFDANDLQDLKDGLAESIAGVTERQSAELSDGNEFESVVWRSPRGGDDRTFIRDPNLNLIEVSKDIEKAFECTNREGLTVYNLSWLSATDISTETEKRMVLRLNFVTTRKCSGVKRTVNGILLIEAKYTEGVPEYDPSTVTVIKDDSGDR